MSSSARGTSTNSCGSTGPLKVSISTFITAMRMSATSDSGEPGPHADRIARDAVIGTVAAVLLHATREVPNRSISPATHGFAQLTVREKQIAACVASGLTDRAIAGTLQISYWTVRTHLDHIFEKLAVTNRAALVARLHRGRQRPNRRIAPASKIPN
jgi:DNA-binding CsgD family transcriptional regulator